MTKASASVCKFPVPGGVFIARLAPTLITMVMVAIMIGLGCWQIERLHWKEGLLVSIEAHKKDTPINVQGMPPGDDEDYRPALAVGTYDPKHNFYLIATSLTGEGGYHVLTPFQLFNGTWLMVDRGWIPYAMKDKPEGFSAASSGGGMIQGILRKPQHGWFQPSNRPDSNDWYWADLPVMARMAHVGGFLPYVLALNADRNPSAYPVGGQTRVELPNNHLEYALTWFGLAAALIIIYGVQGFNRTRKH